MSQDPGAFPSIHTYHNLSGSLVQLSPLPATSHWLLTATPCPLARHVGVANTTLTPGLWSVLTMQSATVTTPTLHSSWQTCIGSEGEKGGVVREMRRGSMSGWTSAGLGSTIPWPSLTSLSVRIYTYIQERQAARPLVVRPGLSTTSANAYSTIASQERLPSPNPPSNTVCRRQCSSVRLD